MIAFGLTAHWYVMPRLRNVAPADAMVPFLLFHAFRYVGLAFLIPGVTRGELPPGFAVPTAYGDLLAAVLALLAAVALRYRWPGARAMAWVFNVIGTADLLNALYQEARLAVPDGDLGATYFLPAVNVPALLVTHVILFILLLSRKRRGGATAGPRATAAAS